VSTQPKTFITPEQYLEIERAAEFKSEYYDGEMFAMAGARANHNLIVANSIFQLTLQLRPKPCRTYPSDMRTRVGSNRRYTYPDVVVVCGEPQYLDEQQDTLINPTLIVEVLSPSTEKFDRGKKFAYYRSIESLVHYLMISSDRMSAELYTRETDGRWVLSPAEQPNDVIDLPAINARLTLADLYEKVDLAAAAEQ
jgi:Uma2 family endonuclease